LRLAVSDKVSVPFPPLPLGLDCKFRDLVGSSLAKATWQKYESGWRAFEQFEKRQGKFLTGHWGFRQ
jgi:hypothetical protein